MRLFGLVVVLIRVIQEGNPGLGIDEDHEGGFP
jgi:hypothetical protein